MAAKPRFDGEWVRLGELCSPKQWRSLKQSEMTPDGYPVYGANGVIGRYPEYNHAEETILVGCRGTCGEVNLCAPFSYVTSNAMCLDGLSEHVDRDYLLCFLKAYDFGKVIGGTSQPQITKAGISSIEVPLFSLEKQIAVRLRLKAVLDALGLRETLLEKLDTLVKSRFAEMFGDPAENAMSWDSISLTSLGSCKNGMNFKSRESGIELPCLGVGDFKDRAFINGVSEIGRVTLDSTPAEDYFLRDGDIVFVRSNGNKELVGRCLAVFPDGEKAVYSGFCIRLRVESDQVRIPYLIWALRHPSMRRQMFGRGANVQNLNQKMMAKVMIPIPPLSRQDCFLDFAVQVDKSRFIVQQQIEKLQMLYDSLAQEYFS